MPSPDRVVQRPAAPKQLVLLFHGVGSSARDLGPLAEALAPHLPDAAIVSVQAPDAVGRGWQWFSVEGVTEADRPARVAAAMPRFVQAVRQWQQACTVAPPPPRRRPSRSWRSKPPNSTARQQHA